MCYNGSSMVEKICLQCGTIYFVQNYRKNTSKFCSFRCNMLDKHAKYRDKTNESNSKRMIGNKLRVGLTPYNKGIKTGKPAWNRGKKMVKPAWNKGKKWEEWISEEGAKAALKNIGPKCGEKHWNWKGGISNINHLIRRSKKYQEWRIEVLKRDRFSCVICGYRSIKKRDIRVDHIKPFILYPELRFNIDNGRTLCIKCDSIYGWNYFRDFYNNKKNKE